ncbi:stage II sporulation protein R [Orenia metallireducens]|jgi:stage II sporulation protein R|uniref:Stage II sporulation protein R n=1 Tax=Orenia metallireducens TaxID=1413210 RepID=A0A285GVZ3_9FIRM|nr:stage II sporulation protein R [Orenia metallireducens]PRX31095.1 stage II sporulation protein R [Orenia metallireducens]SNY27628.1 stage II sporulation protein R [Orenia metallireducens]
MKRVRFVILIVIVIVSLFILQSKSSIVLEDKDILTYGTDDLLRLHIVANSNTLEDQRIKREIRDEIIKRTSKLFASLDNPFQAKSVVKKNLSYIKDIVEDKLAEYNKDYTVSLKLGEFEFPTRSYGDMTLAAGKYQALKILLGKGGGENWWCVLFPPLCFVDSMDKLSEDDLKKLATNKDYVAAEDMDVEFKFKFIEYLKDKPTFVKSKLKFFHILETPFPGLDKIFFSTEKGKE